MKPCALWVIQNSSHHLVPCHYVTPLMSGTLSPGTCAPSFPTTRPTSTSTGFLLSETDLCADPQEVSLCYLAELTIVTGYEPKDLSRKRGFTCQTIYSSTDQVELDTYDSAQNLVTPPPESDSNDERIRDLLVFHHCTHRSEKQMRNDRNFIALNEKTRCPVHHKIR